jgi:hypothetical protein
MTESLTAAELLTRLYALSERLTGRGIYNEIKAFREDGMTVVAHVPGEYWEIDLLEDGTTNVEVFRTTGEMGDESAIERLISEYGEKPKH